MFEKMQLGSKMIKILRENVRKDANRFENY